MGKRFAAGFLLFFLDGMIKAKLIVWAIFGLLTLMGMVVKDG